MKFINRFFKQFFPQYQYQDSVSTEDITEITPIYIQDEALERTDLYLRDYRYKIAMFYADSDLKKNIVEDESPDSFPDSSPIPRHPRPFSS